MNELVNSNQNNSKIFISSKKDKQVLGQSEPDLNIQAHYSDNLKIQRARRIVNEIPEKLPVNHIITPHEMDIRMKNIYTDIYEGTKKERRKQDFNIKVYLEIFSSIALLTAIITIMRKLKK